MPLQPAAPPTPGEQIRAFLRPAFERGVTIEQIRAVWDAVAEAHESGDELALKRLTSERGRG
jgi:hypothetical protein